MLRSSPVECAREEVMKNLRIESYFNLNTESSDKPPRSKINFAPRDPSEPDKLERIRPKMLKNQAEIQAMEDDRKPIVSKINDVKSRDEFLASELETFDRHLKVLAQARVFDLYADSGFTLCSRYHASEAPASPQFPKPSPSCEREERSSAPNPVFAFLQCLGLKYLIDSNEDRIPKIRSLEESTGPVSRLDNTLTGSSGTTEALPLETLNQDGSRHIVETERKQVELSGEPLHLIQNKLFPISELWGRLETLMFYGVTEADDKDPKDPLAILKT
ncbi:hypothetical protein PtB15_9B658 [Puccinia triticina]|nr:hypothetical protein PtB15_9B658 [Puccinia triticina]